MELSVVIPAYNEECRLPGTLRAVLGYLDRYETGWQVLVVDDGSTDATAQAVRSFADPRLDLIRWPVNRGKGHAVRVGVLASTASRVLVSDADLSAPIEELPRLQAALDAGAGAAIGSRAVRGSTLAVRQDPLRELCGRVGNSLIRGIAVPGIADTQCGFKLYDGEQARLVYRLARLDGWCSDAEVLHLFTRLGFRVTEVPIRWSHQPGSKVRRSAYVAGLAELLRIRRFHRRLPALDVCAASTSWRLGDGAVVAALAMWRRRNPHRRRRHPTDLHPHTHRQHKRRAHPRGHGGQSSHLDRAVGYHRVAERSTRDVNSPRPWRSRALGRTVAHEAPSRR